MLEAWQEGAANCRIYLELKEDNTFVETSHCFGDSEISGNYSRSGDTVYFHDVSDDWYVHGFAVLHKAENADTFSGITLFRNPKDNFGYTLRVNLDQLSR